MSQENVEVVRRMAQAWNEGGWEGVADRDLLHPAVEYHDDRRWPEARSAVGVSALVARFVEVMDVMGKEAKVEVEELLDAGENSVVLICRFTGEARASGLHHDYRWGFVCRVADQQITYIQAYLEPESALEAAGLSVGDVARKGDRSAIDRPLG
jgi:ketosteroid isomerase-like protein